MIRAETPRDYDAISQIHREAFADHPFSQQTEHLIVLELRRAGAMSVSLVAEVEGEVVGHVAFSPATIGGRDCGWYVLGPIGVLPRLQRRGIGKALVAAGLDELRKLGAGGCFLVGDPGYYPKLGFAHDPGLTMAGIPPEVCMAMHLAGERPQGEVVHHPAFLVKPE